MGFDHSRWLSLLAAPPWRPWRANLPSYLRLSHNPASPVSVTSRWKHGPGARRWCLLALLAFGILLTVSCDDDNAPGVGEPTTPESATHGAGALSTPAPSPAVTATSGPVGSATPARVSTGTPAQEGAFRNEAPTSLPGGHVLWIELGCFQCDGPTDGLRRVYRTQGGDLRSDDVLPAQVRGTPGYISGLVVAPDGSDIVLAWCTGGNCGPAGQVVPGARITLYRSRDGGITYEWLAAFTEVFTPQLLTGGEVLIAGPYRMDNTPPGYRLLPSMAVVTPPPSDERLYPIAGPDGAIWWSAGGGKSFVDASGAPAIMVHGSAAESIRSFVTIPGSNRLAYTAQARERFYAGIVERDGTVVQEFFTVGGLTAPSVMLDERTGFGNAAVTEAEVGGRAPSPFVGLLPALINLETGTALPFDAPFLDEPFRNGRNIVRAATRGTFARVVNTGGCLNLRERPDPAAPVVACAADGVLGRTQAVAQPAGGPWYNLRLPDGREGWGSGDYLEH